MTEHRNAIVPINDALIGDLDALNALAERASEQSTPSGWRVTSVSWKVIRPASIGGEVLAYTLDDGSEVEATPMLRVGWECERASEP